MANRTSPIVNQNGFGSSCRINLDVVVGYLVALAGVLIYYARYTICGLRFRGQMYLSGNEIG